MAGYIYKETKDLVTVTQRVFAIGFKNWVEIRVGLNPPAAVTSKVTKTIKVRDYDDYTGRVKRSSHDQDLEIKMVRYDGCRVVCCIPAVKFYQLTRLVAPEHDAMKELTGDHAKTFLKWKD